MQIGVNGRLVKLEQVDGSGDGAVRPLVVRTLKANVCFIAVLAQRCGTRERHERADPGNRVDGERFWPGGARNPKRGAALDEVNN